MNFKHPGRVVHFFCRAVCIRRRGWLFGLGMLMGAMSLVAQTYVPPPNPRQDINLDANWRFIQSDAGTNAVAPGFDDSSWTNLNLPHTWDIADGQDGPTTPYYYGIGWYRNYFTVAGTNAGLHFLLKFDGAFLVADVWVNGTYAGGHQGGFSAFAFDVTSNVVVGATNLIAVRLNNAVNSGLTTNIPPLAGDFTYWGGIYRDVHLLVTDPVQISPLDYGSPGVYLMPTGVSAGSANLQVTTMLSNSTAVAASLMLRTVITDAATNLVTTLTNFVTLPAASVSNVVAHTIITNPHLWNGLTDPYLYQAFVEEWQGTNVTDLVAQPLGFRFFSVDPANGFFLNGVHYDLHGVSVHQDWYNCGWALSDAQRETNFLFIKEIGATAIRMPHYEHNDYEYTLADRAGVIVWTEVPNIQNLPGNASNILQQVHELVRQRFNHPSVVCWGMYNEITGGAAGTNLVAMETNVAKLDDPTRLTTGAANAQPTAVNTFTTDLVGFNEYYGWYASPINGLAAFMDNNHASYPNRPTGLSEYGAGASIYQHSENPVAQPASNGGLFHPEEWQDLVHETNWFILKTRPFVWTKFVWNLFDFASDSRHEGDTPGRNDKGLVTYDRQVRKDAFFFYQASWTTNPMVYITGHTFTNRLTNVITAKVYANCDTVQLYLNGVSQGAVLNTNCTFTWPVELPPGTNNVLAIGTQGGIQVTDSLVWIAPLPPPTAALVSPTTNTVFLTGTNDALLLSATAGNPAPGSPLTTTWSQTAGPGPVTFGNANALVTTANFSTNGTYGLTFTASNGSATSLALTVVVNPPLGAVTNGLLGWWKMDETGGATAFDSSTNGRNATVSGATFTPGYLANALNLTGGAENAAFTSVNATQTTMAAWVYADSQGGSSYPFILGAPGYHIIFRFDGSAHNRAFDFATATAANVTTVNGEWATATDSINTGAWYHVAVSYDKSNVTNQPVLYVNGVAAVAATLTAPSVTTPSYAGTTYIGNSPALTRGWDGLIDDLRIYNRLLSAAEVAALAGAAAPDFAPVVNAGPNQTVPWPATASLAGSVPNGGPSNPPGTVTVVWSEVNGPGTVAFAQPDALSTAAGFSVPGTYQLQLTANDGQVATVGSLTVSAITAPDLSVQWQPGVLQLSWPADGVAWGLQYQTNPVTTGLGTNWQNWSGPVTNPFVLPLSPAAGSAYYRLIYPP